MKLNVFTSSRRVGRLPSQKLILLARASCMKNKEISRNVALF